MIQIEMIVLFLYLTTNTQGEEHLGTASIAAYLEKYNYEAKLKLIIFDPNNYDVEKIADLLPLVDIIGFPLFTSNAKVIFELSKEIKEKRHETLISVGGPLATDAAKEILEDCKDIDIVVLGDGEETYLKLVNLIENKKDYSNIEHILVQNDKNSNSKKPFITNIENKPWVSRQYLEQTLHLGFTTARLTAARGCCASCAFCSHNSYTKGTNKIWRGRDIVDVYNEVIYLYHKYGVQSFTINDGSFEDPGKLGKERIRKFCELILNSGYKFHFWSFLRAETFKEDDLSLIHMMKDSGFTSVFIGVESQNTSDLLFYHKKATPEANRKALSLFKSCGINVIYGFILFNPVSTRVSLKENYDFLKEIGCWRPRIFISRLDINYKTMMYYKCKELNLLNSDFNYLYTRAYRFVDNNVIQIWDFIETNLADSIIFSKYDDKIFGMNNFLYSFLAFMPDDVSAYLDKFNSLLKDISKTIVEYFYDLYDVMDLQKAKKNIPIFEEKMSEYVKQIDNLKMKMLMHKKFTNYLRQFSHLNS